MLRTAGELGLGAAVAIPLLNAVLTISIRGGKASRRSAALAWLGAVGALVALVSVALHGNYLVGLPAGNSLLQLRADRLTATLALFIAGVGALVKSFSVRYLSQDGMAWRFAAGADLVVASMTVVATASNITLLAIAWIGAGISFAAVLGYRRDLPGVSRAARMALWHFVGGDAALAIAVAIVVAKLGNLKLGGGPTLAQAAERLGWAAIPVAALITLAALTRSAQGPMGRWLPASIAAPTPTSALLHAGVVNGGGILLIRMAGLAQSSAWVAGAGLAIAVGTASIATRLMRHRADVKGELAYSTVAQMAFMTAEASVGAYLATLVHLMSHGAFKASLFLSSGSRVRRGRGAGAHRSESSATAKIFAATVATAAGAAALAATLLVGNGAAHRGGEVLAAFVVATAASAAWTFTRHIPEALWAVIAGVAMVIVASFAYAGSVVLLGQWMAPSVPTPAHGVLAPMWLLALAAVSAMVALAGRTRRLGASLTAWSIDAATATAARERVPGFLLSLRGGAGEQAAELEEGDAA
ncbi:MAG: proton-conducting transporter membrane subunit [Nitrospiraceae bacterium]|nr:proton-conducting transporter membrane subunit [Nitrospiraceae bacterium]